MKFNFKKVASVLASAAMVGSTMGFAAAATYPAPFVSGGASDVAIVVGSGTGADDMLAATDIGANLGAKVTTGSVTGATPAGGDSALIAKSSNNVNMVDTLSSVFGATVDDDDLVTLLADGVYNDKANTEFKYEQKITLGSGLQLMHFADSNYKDSTPTIGINLSSTGVVMNYTLDFVTDPYYEPYATYIETTTIKLLGKDYYVLDATNSTSTDHKLTLLDSANSATVAEGETITAQGHQVSVDYISTSEVVLNVDGKLTDTLSETETYKLSDGTYIGIQDIMSRDVAGTVGKVKFSIGSGKLEITNAQAIELNDETESDIYGYITISGAKMQKIILEWKTNDYTFLTPASELTMSAFKAIKLSFPEFVKPAQEVTTIEDGSDTYMQIKTTIKDGDVTIPILYSNSSGEFVGIGKDASNQLLTMVQGEITGQYVNVSGGTKYMVLSWNDSTSSESYYVQFSDIVQSSGINYTAVKYWSGGEWVTKHSQRTGGDTVSFGSAGFTINSVIRDHVERGVNITLDAGSSINKIFDKSGEYYAEIYFPIKGCNFIDIRKTKTNGLFRDYRVCIDPSGKINIS